MKKSNSIIATAILLLSLCALLTIYSSQVVSAQTTTVKVEPSTTTPNVGQTLTVNITISNVQNLFGVDVTLNWNTSALIVLTNTSLLGVESNPTGVLHESVDIVEASVSQEIGEYHLVATSTGSAEGFTGSGIIASLTFNVTNTGTSTLELQSDLADKPAAGDNSNLIDHTDLSSTITVAIPEFPTLPTLLALIFFATSTLAISKKYSRKSSTQLNPTKI